MTYQGDVQAGENTVCYHCGDALRGGGVHHDAKAFCCNGCKTVYEILNQNKLCRYYSIEETPGIVPRPVNPTRFSYLDDPSVVRQLIDFDEGGTTAVSFSLPDMHCASCVWLLENLYKLDTGILQSRVDFLKKRITLHFEQAKTSLRKVVELLVSLGYEPEITLESLQKRPSPRAETSLYYRIGIAGFCFGNIMILSFPEYLSGGTVDLELRRVFTALSLVLSLPVVLYCSTGYFRSAIAGLSRRIINLDVPIALGILIVFVRSAYEILAQQGPGYLDSLSGLVFFLLLGRLFQNKTYDHLNFERSYASYFPLAVSVRKEGLDQTVPVGKLDVGDRIIIRNEEIVPADAILLNGDASIDYSFVTGEAQPMVKSSGDLIFAGGKQIGEAIELEVVKEVSQSYLTQLWNNTTGTQPEKGALSHLSNTVGKYFTAAILALAAIAGGVWLPSSTSIALDAITSILIVACPCALALATPFTFGTGLRILGKNGFYLKNTGVVEALARIQTVVLDKTGTLTYARGSCVTFEGSSLAPDERALIAAVVRNSRHPLSRAIQNALAAAPTRVVERFREIPNAGLEGTVDGVEVRLGSARFVLGTRANASGEGADESATLVYVALNGVIRGHFVLTSRYREGIDEVLSSLRRWYHLIILSGDTPRERVRLRDRFGHAVALHFEQSPTDKMTFVSALQAGEKKVMMIGDGLNDAGALRQADVGVAITDDISAFTPACDAILSGAALARIDQFVRFGVACITIVLVCYGISIIYNIIGLSFAFRGELSPLIAAILMPLSSVSVVAFATLTTRWVAKRRGLL